MNPTYYSRNVSENYQNDIHIVEVQCIIVHSQYKINKTNPIAYLEEYDWPSVSLFQMQLSLPQ